MTSKSVLFALMAMWGVTTAATLPANAQDDDATTETEDVSDEGEGDLRFTDRVWVRAEADENLPGSMQVFLSDGTLVSDSCWETYRLSAWRQVDDRNLVWNEDGMDISAEIVSLTEAEMVLRLDVGGGMEQRFVAADVPTVCPDMPR
jgi:hypothetical protein